MNKNNTKKSSSKKITSKVATDTDTAYVSPDMIDSSVDLDTPLIQDDIPSTKKISSKKKIVVKVIKEKIQKTPKEKKEKTVKEFSPDEDQICQNILSTIRNTKKTNDIPFTVNDFTTTHTIQVGSATVSLARTKDPSKKQASYLITVTGQNEDGSTVNESNFSNRYFGKIWNAISAEKIIKTPKKGLTPSAVSACFKMMSSK